MILAIDAGNTVTKLAFFEGDEVRLRLSVPSDSESDAEDLWFLLQGDFPSTSGIEGVILCSVVPALTPVLAKLSEERIGREAILFDWRTRVGLRNRYHPPKDVGADRLANAFAAWKLYGSPVMIVDIGTALTVDVVSPKGEYLGGIIAPGVEMAAEALWRKAALLPHVVLEPVKDVLGDSTVSSIRSGLTHGFAAMISGLIAKLREQLGFAEGTEVILTGGHGGIFGDLLFDLGVRVDGDLTLKGLNLIYQEISGRGKGEGPPEQHGE
jgi:type III pantothenate kinase